MIDRQDKPAEDIGHQARRRQATRDNPGASPLRGLSAFGMIGWSIAVPAVGGAFLGLWLDRVASQGFSWTIALILGGIAVGALIAWSWMDKEYKGDDIRLNQATKDRNGYSDDSEKNTVMDEEERDEDNHR